jgi:hypothetical protein
MASAFPVSCLCKDERVRVHACVHLPKRVDRVRLHGEVLARCIQAQHAHDLLGTAWYVLKKDESEPI